MWGKSLTQFRAFNFNVALSFFNKHQWTSRQQCKGYKFFVESYIHDIWTEGLTIKGKCYKSQKKNDKPHQMYMIFEEISTLTLRQVHCTCEAGDSESCNHVVGFAYLLQDLILRQLNEIPEDNISCTSEPMVWNKPRGKRIESEKVSEAIFQKPTNITRKKKPVQSTLFDSRTSTVKKVKNSDLLEMENKLKTINAKIPFSYLLSQNQQSDTKLLSGIEVSVGSTLHHQLKNSDLEEIKSQSHGFKLPLLDSEISNIFLSIPPVQINEFVEMTFNKAVEIEQKTQAQADCTLWHIERKKDLLLLNLEHFARGKRRLMKNFYTLFWEV